MNDIVSWLARMARQGGRRPLTAAERGELITAADIICSAREVLAELEWAADSPNAPHSHTSGYCPACGAFGGGDEHDADCKLGSLIDYIRPAAAHA
jgi:hypothetical protein